jgi:hypothetical protein
MRSRANAGIFAIAPINEIMSRFCSWAGVVRDFIGG